MPRSTYSVCFRPRPADAARPEGRVPRVARQLALAHKIDGMIRCGEVKDMADAARHMEITRARITQLMNLLLLAPAIQQAILSMPVVERGRDPVTERSLRPIVAEPVWDRQLQIWQGGTACRS